MLRPRLLVLDDEPSVSQTIGLMAQSAGAESRSTCSPCEFFREMDDWNPTHVAIDLVMPHVDGVEIMRQLALRGCQARIIITSGVGARVLDAARRSAAERGLDIVGLLAKPFAAASLGRLLQDERSGYRSHAGTQRAAPTGVARISKARLRRALEQDEFRLRYQPKVDCRQGSLVGFEALVRWCPPNEPQIMPDQFIPLAETSGLITALTETVVAQGLSWLSRHFPNSTETLAINLSAKSLLNTTLSDELFELSRRYRVAPERLILELTETSAMEDSVLPLDVLTRIRMKGFQLAIDDFGTGYSSMVQLVRLPFSELKVDKSFVLEAGQSHESRAVIKSIIDLGHSLGLRVTAEGIENTPTLDFVSDAGCDSLQGYLLAPPLAPEKVMGWVDKWCAEPHHFGGYE